MYGEKILISAADGMEQLISLFLLKIANPFYSCLEMWPILYVDFSKCRVVTLVALASLHTPQFLFFTSNRLPSFDKH